jgi:O-antigen/teichoic acid export membrane protein
MADEQPLRRLARGGVAGLVGAVSSACAGILLVAIVLRSFPDELAGAFFAATSVFLIATAVVELGTDAGLARFIPIQVHRKHKAAARGVVLAAIVPVLVLAAVATAAMWTIAPLIAQRISTPSDRDSIAAVLRIMAFFIPAAAVYDSVLATTRGLGTVRPTVLLENVTRQLSQPLLASVVVILGGGVLTLSGAYLIPMALAWSPVFGGLVAFGSPKRGPRRKRHRQSPTRGIGWEFWRFSGPRAVGRISQVGLRRADIVLVAALAGPGEAAVYTAATAFMTLGQLGVRAIQQVLGPQLSRLLVEGNQAGARTVVQTATAWSIILAWPVYLGCASLAPTVLKLFDVGSREATLVVVILASAMLVAIGTGPVDVALLMAGKSVLSLSNNLAALIVNIGLDLFLIPEYGIVGAAVGWACGLLVGNLLPTFQVHRELGSGL